MHHYWQQTIGHNNQQECGHLAQHLQCIMLFICQYRVCIIYKHSPNLYIMDWLSQNNQTENSNQETPGMNVDVPISKYTNIHNNRRYTGDNSTGCRSLKAEIIHNTKLATQKEEIEQSMKHYWPIRPELKMIDYNDMKSRRIIIPSPLQRQILEQLHS